LWVQYEMRLKNAGVGRDDPMGSASGNACYSH